MPVDGQLIVPRGETMRLSPFHDVELIQVNLRKEDSHKMGWSSRDGTKYMLSKPQVEELGSALEISFPISEPLPVEDYVTGRENIIRWKAGVSAVGTSGKERSVTKTYELDMRLKDVDGVDGSYIILARMRKRDAERKAKDNPEHNHFKGMPKLDAPQEEWDKWVEEGAMKEWKMTNRHRVRRAETGASLAAARTLLNIKSTYTEKELAKPFIVVHSEVNYMRALEYGGVVGDMARAVIGASFTKQLGLQPDVVAGLLESTKEERKVEGPEDLFPATEEEIENLISDMVAAGFPNRAACDQRSIDIFEEPMSKLTKRHTSLMREYVELSAQAKDQLTADEFEDYKTEIKDTMRVCYSNGSSIYDLINLELYDRIHPEVVEGEIT